MMQAGLPTALHANARTERDFEGWGELIAERPEIQYLAFEFATGAGRGERLDWHVAQLTALAARVPQRLGGEHMDAFRRPDAKGKRSHAAIGASVAVATCDREAGKDQTQFGRHKDRKSTRLNSS